ncbi:MAG: tRNA (N6-threonylcarbamoyladenosine(37)-N6)-methyltransferase TrmO [Bacteroidetes bacterium]|nr:tRNA (N6-threonylcarbamoyladenosine(37)-N6)-methyltransferase TrmO [Bacteroidota bacterium]MCL5025927.1 tRNA (N6-threonylcarbamoyladenosine(37)-N6)-methyltransferase TrmO [Chloroflexota bacterium]
MQEMLLQPIGVVHSPVADPQEMPVGGVPADVEVYAPYAEGLRAIETNTHLQIIAWMDRADRTVLLGGEPPRGVFGLRSPARPNPLGLTPARLLAVEGRMLRLDRLDLVDATPVIDIKRYSPGWDCIFSARTSREMRFPASAGSRDVMSDMLVEAVNFHGEECAGLAMGIRAMWHAMQTWQVGRKDSVLRLWLSSDGCIADALQALSGATLGSGRLKVPGGRVFRIARDREGLVFYPLDIGEMTADEVLDAPLEQLFTIRQETLLEEKPIAQAKPGTEDLDMLVEAVRRSLVNNKLPCAVAYRLADELGVHVSEVGHAADASGVKISFCQLGCFK